MGREARDRVPPDVRARRGRRPRVLPQARPQRGRRAELHAAADVRAGAQAEACVRELPRQARGRGRDHGGRGVCDGRDAEGIAGPRADRREGGACGTVDPALPGPLERTRVRVRRNHARDRRRARDACGHRQVAWQPAERLHGAPHDREGRAGPRHAGGAWLEGGVGDRGADGLRHAAEGRPPDPHHRRGRAARHVQPPPCGGAMPGHRRGVVRAQVDGTLRDRQLAADGELDDGLRVRLLARGPQRARDLGGSVRRLRQRRPGGHRPVHLRRRDQVAPLVSAGAVPAAWAGGPGA